MTLCLGSLFFGGTALLQLHIFISDFQLFVLSITEETLLVEMRIWCIKIGNVLILHLWTHIEDKNVKTLDEAAFTRGV
jgi:hypothetical protein